MLQGIAQAQAIPSTDTPSTTTLAPIVVRSSADASAAGLKPAYAGGQVARGGRVGVLGNTDMMETPFSLTSYTQQYIQDQQAASIGDVLKNDPTVRVARGFGNYQQVYIVRGLPVFSDDMSYNGLYGLLPRQYLAAELVERVEVLRGATAFLNGAAPGGSGLGGAINISPKRAPNEALTEASVGVESGGGHKAAADIARRFGPDQSVGVRFNAVHRYGDTAVDREKSELTLFSLGLDYRSRDLRVSADLGHQNHRLKETQPSVTIGAGLPVPSAPDASKNRAQPWTFSNERDVFGSLRAEYDINSSVTAWAAAGMRHGDERTDLANPTVVDAAGNTLAYRFVGSRADRISTGEVGVKAKLLTGPVDHLLSASAARYRGRTNAPYAFSSFGTTFLGTLSSNIDNPVLSPSPVPNALIGQTDSLVETSSIALSDTLSFLRDDLQVTVGARHQTIKDGPYDKSRVTPVAGAVYKVNKSISLYGTYIEGLAKGDIAPATSGSTAVANAGQVFSPFQTKQGELGIKLDSGRLGGTLSVFQSRKPVYSVNQSNFIFGQTDTQRNRGVELTAFGEAIRGLRVLGGATYLDTQVANKDAIGAPRNQVNLGSEWDVPGVRGLSLMAQATYTSSQFADAANTQEVPSWTRFDVGARYELDLGQRRVTFRAKVENVADRNHWQSAGGYPGAGYLVLGAPRTFLLTGTVAF